MLQSENAKLSNKVSCVMKEISKLQMENTDLETQPKDISASLANKQKPASRENDSWNSKPPGEDIVFNDLMNLQEYESDKIVVMQEKREHKPNGKMKQKQSLDGRKALKVSYDENIFNFKTKTDFEDKKLSI